MMEVDNAVGSWGPLSFGMLSGTMRRSSMSFNTVLLIIEFIRVYSKIGIRASGWLIW